MLDLYNYLLLTIFLVGLAAILAAIEIGRWFGVRAGGEAGGNVSTLEGAIIGLLALILGFTFAMALSRFEARRPLVADMRNFYKVENGGDDTKVDSLPYAASTKFGTFLRRR